MSGIAGTFESLRSKSERALIPYLTAGFPSLDATAPLLRALDRGGADIIELGVPFSDPIADGPTIQKASTEALAGGVTVAVILEMVRAFRAQSQTPIVLFGAYNPFLHYGIERLMEDAARAGVDGFLIPDLPAEEDGEVRPHATRAGLDLIQLVAPTSPPDRKAMICSHASGFIYYISVKGVTGARSNQHFELEGPLGELRSLTSLPVVVGFGIATPVQAAEVAALADGVVVGSSLVDLVSKNRNTPGIELTVENYIRVMKDAVRRAR
jgi:tryptophan synthase alpha chain